MASRWEHAGTSRPVLDLPELVLDSLSARSPHLSRDQAALVAVDVDLLISAGPVTQLSAVLSGPRGQVVLS